MDSPFESQFRPISFLFGDLAQISSYEAIVKQKPEWNLVYNASRTVQVSAMCLVGVKAEQVQCVELFARALGLNQTSHSQKTEMNKCEGIILAWREELEAVATSCASTSLAPNIMAHSFCVTLRDQRGLHIVIGGARLEVSDLEAVLQLDPLTPFKRPSLSFAESADKAAKLSYEALKTSSEDITRRFKHMTDNTSSCSDTNLNSLAEFQVWLKRKILASPAASEVEKHRKKPRKRTKTPPLPTQMTSGNWVKANIQNSAVFECAAFNSRQIMHSWGNPQMDVATIEPPKISFRADGSVSSCSNTYGGLNGVRPFE